jgi:C4-dicarboxylate transporter DctM subunit
MSPEVIGIIAFIFLLLIIFLGVHVGFALIIVGFVGFAILNGIGSATANMFLIPFDKVTDYTFAAIPLFLLMSAFVAKGGIGTDAYNAARTWIGGVRGGLAYATTVACAFFAACSGSSLAAAVTFGNVSFPEMKKNGYDTAFSAGTILAGASLASMIPPSIIFIVIGILARLSIGKLYIAGVLPGILMMVIYLITVWIICRVKPTVAPVADIKTTIKQKFVSTYKFWPVVLLFILVLGGIYAGIFTAIEAGGIGAFGAFIIAVAQKKLNFRAFVDYLAETTRTTATLIVLLVGAFIFNSFLAITRVPFNASEMLVALPLPSMATLVIILAVYILLGCFFDIYAIMVITIPIVYPAVQAMGYDLIWWSVVMVLISENGCMTPPFGINLFAIGATIKQKMTDIYRGVFPFVVAQVGILIVLVAIPWISTVLVRLME